MAYTPEQKKNIALALELSRGYPIKQRRALLEAMAVESNFRHLNYGDRDSVGVLQQRPSQGWGPATEDAATDINQFLARMPKNGFQGTAGQLAQSIQRSAFPERYDQRRKQANELLRGASSNTRGLQTSQRGAVRQQSGSGRQPIQGLDSRKLAAQGLLGFALNYAKTGEINNDQLATAVGAVSRAGSVEVPVRRGEIPRSKGRGEVGNGVVDKVLAAAHTQVGKPYVFGSGPDTSSFDCSDLLQWAYKQVGIDIPRTTGEMMKALPQKSWKNLAPGDLIFKSTPGGTNVGGHVVMYVGGGKVIAAPYTGTVVQYQPLSKFKNGSYHVRSVV